MFRTIALSALFVTTVLTSAEARPQRGVRMAEPNVEVNLSVLNNLRPSNDAWESEPTHSSKKSTKIAKAKLEPVKGTEPSAVNTSYKAPTKPVEPPLPVITKLPTKKPSQPEPVVTPQDPVEPMQEDRRSIYQSDDSISVISPKNYPKNFLEDTKFRQPVAPIPPAPTQAPIAAPLPTPVAPAPIAAPKLLPPPALPVPSTTAPQLPTLTPPAQISSPKLTAPKLLPPPGPVELPRAPAPAIPALTPQQAEKLDIPVAPVVTTPPKAPEFKLPLAKPMEMPKLDNLPAPVPPAPIPAAPVVAPKAELPKIELPKISAPKAPELTKPVTPSLNPMNANEKSPDNVSAAPVQQVQKSNLETASKVQAPIIPALPPLPSGPAPQQKVATLPPLDFADNKPTSSPSTANKTVVLPPISNLFPEQQKRQAITPPPLPQVPAPATSAADEKLAMPPKPTLVQQIPPAPEPVKLPGKPETETVMLDKPTIPAATQTSSEGLEHSITYTETQVDFPISDQSKLQSIAQRLKADKHLTVTVYAYASGTLETESVAKRNSLARALKIREFFLGQQIPSDRIAIRPQGNKAGSGVPDRVDIFIGSSKQSQG